LDTDLQLSQYVPDYVLPVFLKVLGDPNFQPETLLSYEAGYRKLLTPRFYADLSLFYNQYNDLSSFGAETLSFDTSAVTPTLLLTLPYANGIKGATKGGEIATTWKAANWLDLKTSYSYLDMNLEDKPGYTDTATLAADEGSSPRHEATIQALINLPKGFELDPTYRYVSELWALGVPAYGTMDVRFGWHVGRNVEFSLDGQNLFQPHHPEFSGDPGALIGIKRSAYVQMTWRR
jgi:iron complex outermembrane receptor protein